MKKTSILLYTLFLIVNSMVFAQDTLRNLSNSTPRTIDKYASGWGYFTGHNSRYTEEFAEKYYINGTRSLLGVISEHTGKVGNPKNISQFKAYTVGTNRLPARLKASKNIRYGDIDLSGTPMLTIFPTPASVTDSFYVSFNLTDYAHGGFDGDTIGLLYGVNGSRPNGDLPLFGRNIVRHHSHGAPLWKDFYSQNFTPVATHLAIFPILSAEITEINELATSEFQITKVFPNPFIESVTLSVLAKEVNSLSVFFYNEAGQIIKKQETENAEFNANGEVKIDCKDLPVGKYILLIKGENTGIATQVVKLN
ncbi:MAG: T9SS C-terminal target domain-containing protein [Cytophagales bacterium]|nr:MAG: T9SS C-terminal target domain-containing protein [Cytophagales bacterium]